ncbi:MAG: hypothetical protein A2X80_10000 [Geobacteraceae bacterium GWB2_52_12]|nr:MAG: hypothetical protein A2X80_10000 [Geobacteraceae bacterium GWB2_52_12]
MKEFAAFLEVNEKTLSALMNARNLASQETALQISQKMGDFELLEILGYSRPDGIFIPSSLPSDLQSRLRLALEEISATIKAKSLDPESDEAVKLSSEILGKYRLTTVSSIRKSG